MAAEFILFSENRKKKKKKKKKDLPVNVPLFYKSALKKFPKGVNYILGREEGAGYVCSGHQDYLA